MTVGICGAGTMGAGIAQVCLQSGFHVLLYDTADAALAKAEQYITNTFEKALRKGRMSSQEYVSARVRLTLVSSLHLLHPCSIVVEAIIEQAKAKQQLYDSLEDVVAHESIIASNTSSLSITALAASMRYPERFVGLHFFNPAPVMRLVEIVSGMRTSPTTVEYAVRFAQQLGKQPVKVRDVPGFIVNRVARNYYLEAMRLVSEGAATIPQVDTLMRSAGFKMGPFELMDVIGMDVNFTVSMSLWEQYFYEPRLTPVLLQKHYVDAGLLGRKTGEGFYKYGADGEKILPQRSSSDAPSTSP
ncbi:MAG: 3-hydroxyacyl-CoA dehydrogenase NAD-binding domain-containing protein [Bacteroidota bacterium]|nr:3-hydroxyacyl-CoA dehydrogenase NAD-binding domain-containing protein [Candidatus Kapabacteria bacterium]MDW8219539.1 3-hydroxyacyl-CoA dehydrogenase NAD-binding domain-containing protein [Bacteroidota bacterium]